MKRVNQSYVIATSTRVELGGAVAAAAAVNDEYFAHEAAEAKEGEEKFFAGGKSKSEVRLI